MICKQQNDYHHSQQRSPLSTPTSEPVNPVTGVTDPDIISQKVESAVSMEGTSERKTKSRPSSILVIFL